MSYQFIFGPVPSRRLGLSLGVDLVPQKTCSLDCVYCECGRTTELTLSPHEYVPVAGVIQEIDDYLSLHSRPDVLTFSGFGEPTLHSGIDTIVAHVKSRYPALPVVLLTNSTLLHKKEVRNRLMQIDRIIASVDAVTEDVFRRVNRPHGQLTCEMVLNGIRDLKKEYSKELWLEIFIIPDINNVNSEINVIKRFINEIQPDKIQLNTLDRPGTEDWVQPATPAEISTLSDFLVVSEAIGGQHALSTDFNTTISLEDRILAVIDRRPCTSDDLIRSLGAREDMVSSILKSLVSAGRISTKRLSRGNFYFGGTSGGRSDFS